MTDSHRKRKFAGEPIKDKRKLVPEPPKHGHQPKPKEYVLKTIETSITEYETVTRYPTRKAREQAKEDFRKKAAAVALHRAQFKFYRRATKTVRFEESEA